SVAGYYYSGAFQDMPEPIVALEANGAILSSPSQGPASILVNGVAWRHSGMGGSAYDVYFGPRGGQQLTLQGGAYWISDPYHGINTSGTYAAGTFQNAGQGVTLLAADMGGVA